MSTYPDQITLSLPPKWNKIVRDNAKKENKSLNSYIKEILINKLKEDVNL